MVSTSSALLQITALSHQKSYRKKADSNQDVGRVSNHHIMLKPMWAEREDTTGPRFLSQQALSQCNCIFIKLRLRNNSISHGKKQTEDEKLYYSSVNVISFLLAAYISGSNPNLTHISKSPVSILSWLYGSSVSCYFFGEWHSICFVQQLKTPRKTGTLPSQAKVKVAEVQGGMTLLYWTLQLRYSSVFWDCKLPWIQCFFKLVCGRFLEENKS